LIQVLFGNSHPSDSDLVISGFPIGFDAITICILYPVLRPGCLDGPELIKRTAASIMIVALGVIAFLAYQAGYLRHP
jgi:uncharacterized membrane protein (DUF441 family)